MPLDSGNVIDTANGIAINSQQQFDRLFAAINQLALAVSELRDKVEHFEHSPNEKTARIDQRLDVMENAINTRMTHVERTKTFYELAWMLWTTPLQTN